MQARVEKLTKRFGSTTALHEVDLTIESGELFTLLGPSGCGKTTLLRLLAGLEEASDGSIQFDGRRVNALPAHRRDVGMVFQSYALFPHLTVAENVRYGLQARGIPKAQMAERAAEALASVGLAEYGDRAPAALSGGQQQRVALARALVTRPSLLLMDEPLANLDARLRVTMRAEIRRLVKAAGITTLYVTHDQEEALAISDRIGVMDHGRLIQVGRPAAIYLEPASRQVAAFVGACSFLTGRVDGGRLQLAESRISLPGVPDGPITVGVRPEAVLIGPGAADLPAHELSLQAEVVGEAFLGPSTRLDLRLANGETLVAALPAPPGLYAPGMRVTAGLPAAKLMLFHPETGQALREVPR